ncbi:alanine racemase [Acidithiobacillus sulfurivorans]|uniref:Alanine racemase n=1 Tax=Acidithiobacillus sulfurivorans TaxID=1958756 RepID=A0ABS5ZU80_9PROT|nr:alanine racemase [Acidithiobacillus sulfurivorans]MBU2758729.1 alanine racemase [Acidithiobacillus sulfurivorans]
MTRPIFAEISPSALCHNLQVARNHAPQARIMAAVKANAYGHDVRVCAPVLASAGVDAFAVASLEEAETLHALALNKAICLLGGPFTEEEVRLATERAYWLVIHEDRQLAWLESQVPHRALQIFIKVDTGMHRLGFAPERLGEVFAKLQSYPHWQVLGLMSHLARSDYPQDPFNDQQIAVFERMVKAYSGCTLGQHSLANSGAVLSLPSAHQYWVRPGLMLYGLSPFTGKNGVDVGLQPVLSWQSEIVATRHLQAGDWLGYGATWQAAEACRVGVVAAGYGDGYPRQLGSGAAIRVAGQDTRTLARVSMDMLFVDITHIQADIGSKVTLMGAEGPALETLAQQLDTIPYEMSCRIQVRVPRRLRA